MLVCSAAMDEQSKLPFGDEEVRVRMSSDTGQR
jgi:hypothetical protein